MITRPSLASQLHPFPPRVLPVRQQADVIVRNLRQRLDTVLPLAMREAGIDMWLILCQEDDYDPIFTILTPMGAWRPILQIILFYDRGEAQGVERINISGTNTLDLYDRPYRGQLEVEQWPSLLKAIAERDPRRIGINVGSVQWAAGGLTHNLYTQLVTRLPAQFVARLESAEPIAARFLSTLTDGEMESHEHVVSLAHNLIAECYSRQAIVPGVTTTEDLEWYYWQRAADQGLEMAFHPFFNLVRSQAAKGRFGEADTVIRPGDLIHCDVGIRYLRLNSDHQEWAYVLRPDEHDAPAGMCELMTQANRLQDIFMAEFRAGLTGDELLGNILQHARSEGVPNPKVYSHSLGLFLHEPGPLIGLPWEQVHNAGRGDVKLAHNSIFTMELSVTAPLPEWGGQEVRLGVEEDVVFTVDGCRVIGRRQTDFYLV
jgi:Xaa-Pro aminopeptidase